MNKETNHLQINDEQNPLIAQLDELENQLAEKQEKRKEVLAELESYEAEFAEREKIIESLRNIKRKLRASIRTVPAYLLGRRNIKQLYSKAYKQKAAENKLRSYKKYLYDLGFEERALADLRELFFHTEDRYMKQALAWELGLYYANKLDPRKAGIALEFLNAAAEESSGNEERRRKITILQAECLVLLGKHKEAKQLLSELLEVDTHADIYVAMANVEATPLERLSWVNRALRHYNLQEIQLTSDEGRDAYYRLTTDPIQEKQVTTGPKISVIIPAYNAESGIRVAIDSLLNQTWQNLELIVVDDCSTDSTREVVAEYTAKDERVKLLSTPANSGPYIARNIGLKEATGEFVTINDADDWSHPEKIQKQVEHLIQHEEVMANTSAHARLTEDLKPYRRSMPGKYIFSNMSSLMFRREAVLEKVGYWDRVRFAADSEFKNRLIAVFGKQAIVDLENGPLSFPMQSSNSLTANSKFGYNGFLMGVRKEYRESYGYYHKHTDSLYMPSHPDERHFPVPEPMLPDRVAKGSVRNLDVVFIADYREKVPPFIVMHLEALKEMGMNIGLIQMGSYQLKKKQFMDPAIRSLIDGKHIQMLVYGENINCNLLFIHNPGVFAENQKYVPELTAKVVRVILTELPSESVGGKKVERFNLRECSRRIDDWMKVKSKWYPIDEALRENLLENHRRELRSIPLSTMNWLTETKDKSSFNEQIEHLLVEENPFRIEEGGVE